MHKINVLKYLEIETIEAVTDYVGTKRPTITITDLSRMDNSMATDLIQGGMSRAYSSGSYECTYTFPDTICINSFSFCTGFNGDWYAPIGSLVIEAYSNGNWVQVYSGAMNSGDWHNYNNVSTPYSTVTSTSIFSNKFRFTIGGYTYSGGGIVYYGWINKFKINVDIKNIV